MSDPRRLALFVPSLRGGGAERVTVTLARAFAGFGLPVDLLLAQAEGPYLEELPAGVRVVDLAARRVLRALPGLRRYLLEERPRALLSTLTNANVVAASARRLARESCPGLDTRLVLREGNPVGQWAARSGQLRAQLMPALVRRCYPWADALVANAAELAAELAEELSAARPPIVVIPNPLDLAAFRAAAAERLEAADLPPGDGALLVAAGRLTEQKDFATLLRAFARLAGGSPAPRLVILGEGPERPALEAQVRALGLGERVRLPGFRRELPAFLARAALFVHSSRWEGSPNVVAEALALGCPVVAAAGLGATAELLGGGRFGRLVAPGHAEALAQACREALADPGNPAERRARAEEFGAAGIARRYLEVLGWAPEELP
ncbi:MAG: glycosyltransferase [Thermoanaerobaculia bacterium]